MSSLIEVKVYYQHNVYLAVKGKSFREIFELVWLSELFRNNTPIKAVFPQENTTLHMDKTQWLAYLTKEISRDDLIQGTRCCGLYRNAYEVVTDDMHTVEKGSLWKLVDMKLVLINDDEHVESEMDKRVFVECY